MNLPAAIFKPCYDLTAEQPKPESFLMSDPDHLAALTKAIPPEVMRETYRDLASPPLRQFGEDFVKAVRLALFPIQLAAAFQDRVEAWLDKAIRQVPRRTSYSTDAINISSCGRKTTI
jgi:hypothetical protein